MNESYHFSIGHLQVAAPLDRVLADNCDRHSKSYFRSNPTSLLHRLCDLHGSDKGTLGAPNRPYPWAAHSFADYFEQHFHHCRHAVTKVFECGIGSINPSIPSNMGETGRPGASLRVWRDYFPNAVIYGVDVDRDTLFREDRIETYYCDQTDPAAIAAMWRETGQANFDLMIDDGLHTFAAGRCLLEHSFDRLRDGGLYVIEDVAPRVLLEYWDYFRETHHRFEIVNLFRKTSPLHDNSLVVIRK